ncbi:MAG: F0F1 ATP synthase subunit epsilon [Clostridia bacterium]|nr:F0F1 ATP synthase subunit epsilon [Clostridia bacterium]
MRTFPLTVASPDGNTFSGDVVSVILRGAAGDLMVMAGHIPFVTSVVPCDVRIELEDGEEKTGHTDGGILSVSNEGTTLLSGSFKWNE